MKRLYVAAGGMALLIASYISYQALSIVINPYIQNTRLKIIELESRFKNSESSTRHYTNALNEFAEKHRNNPEAYKAALEAMLRAALREVEEKRSKEGYPNLEDIQNFSLG